MLRTHVLSLKFYLSREISEFIDKDVISTTEDMEDNSSTNILSIIFSGNLVIDEIVIEDDCIEKNELIKKMNIKTASENTVIDGNRAVNGMIQQPELFQKTLLKNETDGRHIRSEIMPYDRMKKKKYKNKNALGIRDKKCFLPDKAISFAPSIDDTEKRQVTEIKTVENQCQVRNRDSHVRYKSSGLDTPKHLITGTNLHISQNLVASKANSDWELTGEDLEQFCVQTKYFAKLYSVPGKCTMTGKLKHDNFE